ncbi:hypothetical protein ABC502_14385 [Alkalimonas sp. NCh-2]|uniref:hypothetical protein n=1 Tax=Alkalimonas sp. NCh-2 TaxID=3144846 RepID=UPI0031F697BF
MKQELLTGDQIRRKYNGFDLLERKFVFTDPSDTQPTGTCVIKAVLISEDQPCLAYCAEGNYGVVNRDDEILLLSKLADCPTLGPACKGCPDCPGKAICFVDGGAS